MVERQLDVGGAVTFWSLADWSNREQLQSAFAHHSLEMFMPEPRPSSAALKDALQEVLGGPRVLVRPLASRDGFAVVREDRGSDRNAYATQLVAHVHEGNHPTFEPWSPVVDRVMEVFRKQLGRVSGMQLSGALVKIVDALGGTRLRPSGAVYWVPGNRIHEWSQIAQSVELATEGRASSVYVLRHRLDADAVRAVRDAVVLEVQTEAKRICEDVSGGELGTRALESRRKLAGALREKVNLYEDLLHLGLAGLHRAVDDADQAAATAALLLASQADPAYSTAGIG